MKRLILTLILAIVSSGAMADWTRLDKTESFTLYVNAAIDRWGNVTKMSDLRDFKAPQQLGSFPPYMSAQVEGEYDCKAARSRTIYMTFFSGNMGKGKVITSGNAPAPIEWAPIAEGTIIEVLWRFACVGAK